MYYDELMEKINNYERKRSEINRRYTEQVKQTQMLTPDCVIDEEKSVKWNREEVARRNRSAKAKLAAIRREEMMKRSEFRNFQYDVRQRITKLHERR